MTVMVQCYAEDFPIIFDENNERRIVLIAESVRFFATVCDREAAGCTPT